MLSEELAQISAVLQGDFQYLIALSQLHLRHLEKNHVDRHTGTTADHKD